MFSSMTSSVSNWLGNLAGNDEQELLAKAEENKGQTPADDTKNQPQEGKDGEPSTGPEADENAKGQEKGAQIDLDEMADKALNTAKEWGSYLYSFGKAATHQVTETAKHLKDVVEEKTILGDFSKEQEKFKTEKRDKSKMSEAAVPPWVGYNEEESMKQQIMALSQDKRNFLRNPPSGVQFQFDFEASFPVAMATLQEDPNLQKMRFDLVPKQVKEDQFWRNYFYRVSLIRQSAQLTTLAQQTGTTGENASSKSSSRRSSSDNSNKGSPSSSDYDKLSDASDTQDKRADSSSAPQQATAAEPLESPVGSPPEHEFISDTFQDDAIDQEALKREMQQLGMTENENKEDDIPDWEKELQAELQEYEVVDDGKTDDDLEQEILQQIEEEAKRS